MSSSKVVLVTGGNGGIGYETVKALLQSDKPHHVIMGSRSLEKAKLAIEELKKECPESTNVVEAVQLDLTSDESIEKAFEQVKTSPGRLDTLVNNAGATFDLEFLAGKTSVRDCFNRAYDVNVAGTQVMTYTFMPLLLASADPRLIFVAGLSQLIAASEGRYLYSPPQPVGWPKKTAFETIGYRCSKTALNMLMLDWNYKLKGDGVKVWGVGPGMLATNLGGMGPEKAREMGAQPASLGGAVLKSVVEGERDADVGKIVGKDGLVAF
ncbi:NAD(P)-binding protein [Lophium mytilinum]|uniref:NAD(P)-binding protein n=1 Tax=Lophium mytilinum TaxID=390894 RepID=A0A6A6QWR0_9PEZI|nr:NAD(P)-binding protein [Lophium mytilinum]